MDDLMTFLAARLDEDEAAARAVEDNSAPWPGQWEADGNEALRTHNGWVLATAGTPGGEFRPGVLAHIARHDPARVLREVEAGLAILAEHVPYDCTEPKGQRCFRCASDRAYRSGAAIHEAWPCLTLRSLAAVYSGHPDYRPEWKP